MGRPPAPRPQLRRDSLGCSFNQDWPTTTLARTVLALVGIGLLAGGVLYATLGVWGIDRGSADAWKLALLGLLGVATGVVLLLWAVKPRPPPNI
jgi:uncharacterized membrane protein HdeD (DUF308 family)